MGNTNVTTTKEVVETKENVTRVENKVEDNKSTENENDESKVEDKETEVESQDDEDLELQMMKMEMTKKNHLKKSWKDEEYMLNKEEKES